MASIRTFLLLLTGIRSSSSLKISNITSAVNLTQIYFNNVNGSNPFYFTGLNPGFMTNYYDSTNDQYLWLGIYSYINDTVSYQYIDELEKYSVKTDIFTTQFTQYSNNYSNISLPFTVMNSTLINPPQNMDNIFCNYGCTSPITKDIINCWDNTTFINDEQDGILSLVISIQCKIYYSKTSKWSNIIIINPSQNMSKKYIQVNYGIDVICFNDTYFISYGYQYQDYSYRDDSISIDINSALLDLKGTIIYENMTLISNISMAGPVIFSTKGSDKFAETIAKRYNVTNISGSFMLQYSSYSSVINITNITGTFGYYTSLEDDRFPIYIYNDGTIAANNDTNIFVGDQIISIQNAFLDLNNKCCYIGAYQTPSKSDAEYRFDLYLIITDYAGNNIMNDTLILSNETQDIFPQIIDLPMISTESIEYFLIVFSTAPNDYQYAHTASVAVYYLEYDDNTDKYAMFDAGHFDIVHKQQNDDWEFETFIGYVMPETNYLYFAWNEFYGYGNGGNILYGQTFTVT